MLGVVHVRHLGQARIAAMRGGEFLLDTYTR